MKIYERLSSGLGKLQFYFEIEKLVKNVLRNIQKFGFRTRKMHFYFEIENFVENMLIIIAFSMTLHFVQPEKRPVVQNYPWRSLYSCSWSAGESLLSTKNDQAKIPMFRLFANQLGERPCFNNTEANNCGAELGQVHFHHVLYIATVQSELSKGLDSRSALGPTHVSVRWTPGGPSRNKMAGTWGWSDTVLKCETSFYACVPCEGDWGFRSPCPRCLKPNAECDTCFCEEAHPYESEHASEHLWSEAQIGL
jgi:hypothetical protein